MGKGTPNLKELRLSVPPINKFQKNKIKTSAY
jgi:hypothetical protein